MSTETRIEDNIEIVETRTDKLISIFKTGLEPIEKTENQIIIELLTKIELNTRG